MVKKHTRSAAKLQTRTLKRVATTINTCLRWKFDLPANSNTVFVPETLATLVQARDYLYATASTCTVADSKPQNTNELDEREAEDQTLSPVTPSSG